MLKILVGAGIMAGRTCGIGILWPKAMTERSPTMDNELNNGAAPFAPVPGTADAASNAAATTPAAGAADEWKPDAPADPDDVAEHAERLSEMSDLLGRVDAHVSGEYKQVLDNSDDDTDAPHTTDEAEGTVHVEKAYAAQREAEQILKKENLTNQDVERLEEVLDDMDSSINEATPLSFDPNAEPSPI
jgi:hypothetical protein